MMRMDNGGIAIHTQIHTGSVGLYTETHYCTPQICMPCTSCSTCCESTACKASYSHLEVALTDLGPVHTYLERACQLPHMPGWHFSILICLMPGSNHHQCWPASCLAWCHFVPRFMNCTPRPLSWSKLAKILACLVHVEFNCHILLVDAVVKS